MKPYENTALSPQERARLLLAEMSLEEKIFQLGCAFPRGLKDDRAMEACALGIGQVSTLEMRNLETAQACADFQKEYQKIIMERSPHNIPAIFHMEGLCGPLFQGTTSFPAGIARASGWDPALEREIGNVVGRQERAVGITQTFAPVLDVARDPRMGRQGESYGEDSTLAACLGAAYTAGIQSEKTDGRRSDAVAKHFLGFHQSAGGIHGAHCDIPTRVLREIFAKPFQAAITESQLQGIMPCYCVINGEPVHASGALLTELLRDEMGFNGLTVSDYGAIGNIYRSQHAAESMEEAGAAALEAGMDMELQCREGYTEALIPMIESGKLSLNLVDRAVERVLTAKFRMGLFEHPFALTGVELKSRLHREEDGALSLRSARESLVLMKNDGILPIASKVRKIAIIGPHAANARYLFGGYTHMDMAVASLAANVSMAGIAHKPWQNGVYDPIPGTPIQPDTDSRFDDVLRRQKPECDNLLEGLKKALPNVEISYACGYPIAGDDCSGYGEAISLAQEADLVILTLGGKYGSSSVASMGEGVDASDIGLPECQERCIEKLVELGKPLVGIHFNGRPISSDIADRCLNAILEAWAPSEMGAQAIAEVLTGKINPSGKLPVTVARHAGQLPIYYNHPYGSMWSQGESIGFQNYVDLPHTPRYPFGFGLSYTSFSYSGLHVDKTELLPEERLELSCNVKNIGAVCGTEIVQFFIRDPYATMVRPIQELAGFARVELSPGEEKTVKFSARLSQFAFLDKKMQWKVEKGEMEIRLGSSSQDIRLIGRFRILEDRLVDGKVRGFYAETVVE